MDTLLLEYDAEFVPEELANMGSFNHAYIQARLIFLLMTLNRFTVVSEISISTASLVTEWLRQAFKHEVKPDVALYPKRSVDFFDDEIRMSEMPLLAIEILSPAQGQQSVIDKIKAMLEMGVQSCWLVNPGIQTVTVFRAANDAMSYSAGTIYDNVLDISIEHGELFN